MEKRRHNQVQGPRQGTGGSIKKEVAPKCPPTPHVRMGTMAAELIRGQEHVGGGRGDNQQQISRLWDVNTINKKEKAGDSSSGRRGATSKRKNFQVACEPFRQIQGVQQTGDESGGIHTLETKARSFRYSEKGQHLEKPRGTNKTEATGRGRPVEKITHPVNASLSGGLGN